MKKYCDSPFSTVNIENNGLVSFCLCTSWHNLQGFGNIFKSTLEEIWSNKNKKSLEFRCSILDESFQHCNPNSCTQYHSLGTVENHNNVRVPRLPTTLYFQTLDSTCNLQCPSCRNSLNYTGKPNKNAEDILNKIIDEYQDFDERVMIAGDGSGEFFASVSYMNFLRNPRLPDCFEFSINSNGTLLSKNIDVIKQYKDRFTNINVSLDAATADTYSKTRGHNFEQTLAGIKRVLDLGITVSTQFVTQYVNYHELVQYKELCDSLGVSFVGYQCINHWPHMSPEWWAENQLEDNPKVNYRQLIDDIEYLKGFDNVGFDGRMISLINKKGP